VWEGSFGRATFSEWSGINANLAIAKPSTGGSIPGDRPDFPQDQKTFRCSVRDPVLLLTTLGFALAGCYS